MFASPAPAGGARWFRPRPSPSARLAPAFGATSLVGGGALLWLGLEGAGVPALGLFTAGLAAVLAALAGAATWAATRELGYELADDGVQVHWAGRRLSIPYVAITDVASAQRLVGRAQPRGPSWPGLYVGRARVRGLGTAQFFTTTPDPALLVVLTLELGAVVLSPENLPAFRSALTSVLARTRLEAPRPDEGTAVVDATATPRGRNSTPSPRAPALLPRTAATAAPWSAFHDPVVRWSLAAALAIAWTLVAIVLVGADTAAARSAVELARRLAVGGLLIALVNTAAATWLHPREPAIARLLVASTPFVEVLAIVSALRAYA